MEDFYEHMAEVLEVTDIKPTDVLQQFVSWDSLTILSIISVLDSRYGVHISGAELRALRTLADLESAVAKRMPKS